MKLSSVAIALSLISGASAYTVNRSTLRQMGTKTLAPVGESRVSGPSASLKMEGTSHYVTLQSSVVLSWKYLCVFSRYSHVKRLKRKQPTAEAISRPREHGVDRLLGFFTRLRHNTLPSSRRLILLTFLTHALFSMLCTYALSAPSTSTQQTLDSSREPNSPLMMNGPELK